MQNYIDITLLPSDEIGHYFLWGKIYQQMHLALVEHGAGRVGFAFPEYSSGQPRLGRKLRVFAQSIDELNQLNLSKWLSRLTDYCHITSARSVPDHAQHAIFFRKQFLTSPERLAKRRAKRNGETFEHALAHFDGFEENLTTLPFVELASSSTTTDADKSHRFKLFIERTIIKNIQSGEFNSYGLSKTASVPWF